MSSLPSVPLTASVWVLGLSDELTSSITCLVRMEVDSVAASTSLDASAKTAGVLSVTAVAWVSGLDVGAGGETC